MTYTAVNNLPLIDEENALALKIPVDSLVAEALGR
jgi:hypothetical protein